jgi:MFS family permease
VVVIGVIMSILDTTIVNVALATLGRDLHASLATVQWVSTGYLVALAMAITMTGWASERFGLSSPTAFLPILGGLGLVAAFVYHALHTSVRPLLDLTLFRAPGFAAAAAVVFLIGAALFGSLLARAAPVLPGRPWPVDAQHRAAARAAGNGAA